jgi:hypothetical protein
MKQGRKKVVKEEEAEERKPQSHKQCGKPQGNSNDN